MSNGESKSEVQGRTDRSSSGGQWKGNEGRLLGRVGRCQGEKKGEQRCGHGDRGREGQRRRGVRIVCGT